MVSLRPSRMTSTAGRMSVSSGLPSAPKDVGAALARQFTAANTEYFELPDNAAMSASGTDFTFTSWVYFDSLAAVRILFGKWESTGGSAREYVTYTTPTNFGMSVSDGSTQDDFTESAFGALSTSTWYFLTAQFTNSTQKMGIGVNAGSIEEDASAAGFTIQDGNTDFTIGAYADATFPHDGRIAATGFWKRILTSAERSYLYNGGRGLIYDALGVAGTPGSALKTSLIAYWDLNEASGNAIDSHSTNNLSDANSVTSAAGPGA